MNYINNYITVTVDEYRLGCYCHEEKDVDGSKYWEIDEVDMYVRDNKILDNVSESDKIELFKLASQKLKED